MQGSGSVLERTAAMPTTIGILATIEPDEYRRHVENLWHAAAQVSERIAGLVEDETLTPIQGFGVTYGAVEALFGFNPKYASLAARLPGVDDGVSSS